MATDLYDLLVPALDRGLGNLRHVLDQGELFSREFGEDVPDLLDARLIEDMDPLRVQVQRACDIAKGSLIRLEVVEDLAMADDEETFAALQNRIDRTRGFLAIAHAEAVNACEDRPVHIEFPGGAFDFSGRGFVTRFVLPNFYFHVTTAYAILRMRGVPIGKLDYLGRDL